MGVVPVFPWVLLRSLPGCPVRVYAGPAWTTDRFQDPSMVLDVVAGSCSRRSYWSPDFARAPGALAEGWRDADLRPVDSVGAMLQESAWVVCGGRLCAGDLAVLTGQLRDPAALALALSVMGS